MLVWNWMLDFGVWRAPLWPSVATNLNLLNCTNVSRRRRKSIDVSQFLTKLKLIAVEIAATIVFLVWLYREVIHELK